MRVGKVIVASVVVVGLAATTARATDRVINLAATVPAFCRINGSLTPGAINQTIPLNAAQDVDTTAINVNIGNVICNKASNVRLMSNSGALIGPLGAAGFQHYINYTASVAAPVAANVTANVATGLATLTLGTVVATAGPTSSPNVSVTINPTANTLPLVASAPGTYNDTLTVSITPQ
jgi:hypothetical protein